MIKAVAHAVAQADILGLCLREQLVTHAAHIKFRSLQVDFMTQLEALIKFELHLLPKLKLSLTGKSNTKFGVKLF